MAIGYLADGSCWPSIDSVGAYVVSNYRLDRFSSTNAAVVNSYGTILPSATEYAPGFPTYYQVNIGYSNGNIVQKRFYAIDCDVWAESVPWASSGGGSSGSIFDGYSGDDFVSIGWEIAGLWVLAFCLGMVVRILR